MESTVQRPRGVVAWCGRKSLVLYQWMFPRRMTEERLAFRLAIAVGLYAAWFLFIAFSAALSCKGSDLLPALRVLTLPFLPLPAAIIAASSIAHRSYRVQLAAFRDGMLRLAKNLTLAEIVRKAQPNPGLFMELRESALVLGRTALPIVPRSPTIDQLDKAITLLGDCHMASRSQISPELLARYISEPLHLPLDSGNKQTLYHALNQKLLTEAKQVETLALDL